MATLDNSNVVNGQTINAPDITQLYTALGTGSPGTITGLVMTGSLEGNAATATLATSATTATTATNANFPNIINNPVNPNIYSVVFASAPVAAGYNSLYVDSGSVSSGGAGTGMFYQPSIDTLTVTASFAVTASHALNAGGGSTLDMYTTVDSSAQAVSATWTPFAGVLDLSIGASVNLPTIFSFTPVSGFGRDIIVTANEINPTGTGAAVAVSPYLNLGTSELSFIGATPGTGLIMYQGWYK